jgi:SAM-dependent methyltransferase
MTEYKYIADNAWKAARERLTLLEMGADPWTMRNLGLIGVQAGWHCLEVAGGGGSIVAWLCNQVGPSGHVMATDLDPRFLEAITASNLEVRRHNILTDPLTDAACDLVHARALLAFLPRPDQVIHTLVAALKPGGWLLLEEPDYVSAIPDPSMAPAATALAQKGWEALLSFGRSRGYDTALGRHLYHDVCTAGLVDVQAEATSPCTLEEHQRRASGASRLNSSKTTCWRQGCLPKRNWRTIARSWRVRSIAGCHR